MRKRILFKLFFVLAFLAVNISPVGAAGNPMKLVGTLNPWKEAALPVCDHVAASCIVVLSDAG
ncbi:MAG: hypothetical protein ACM3XO_19735 [Bacteroidota bacterium]